VNKQNNNNILTFLIIVSAIITFFASYLIDFILKILNINEFWTLTILILFCLISVYNILHWGFENHLWKWKIFKYFFKQPNLNGKWVGKAINKKDGYNEKDVTVIIK